MLGAGLNLTAKVYRTTHNRLPLRQNKNPQRDRNCMHRVSRRLYLRLVSTDQTKVMSRRGLQIAMQNALTLKGRANNVKEPAATHNPSDAAKLATLSWRLVLDVTL
jgi:hypothetical protein